MKTLLLVLCVFVATAYGHKKHPAFDQCLADNEMTKEQFQTLKKSSDPKVGCVFACMMNKDGSMNNSTIDVDKIKERITQHHKKDGKLSADKLTEIVGACASEVESVSDKCEKAMGYKKCFHTKMHAANEQKPAE